MYKYVNEYIIIINKIIMDHPSGLNCQQRIIELAEQNNNLTQTYNSLSNNLLYTDIKNQLEESNNTTANELTKIIKQLEELNNKTIDEHERIKK